MDNNQNQNSDLATKTSSTLKNVGIFIWDLVKILIIALVIIVPFRMFVAEPFVVSGSSMLPNFHNGDYLIIDRLSYLHGSPQRGDVVVLLYPKDTSQFFIKRIIGLPGETVSCLQNKVDISTATGQNLQLNETYLPSTVPTENCKPKQVLGSNEYFVMGDNRTASSDSRFWGILPRNDIVGRVWLRVFPFSTGGFFQTPAYQ